MTSVHLSPRLDAGGGQGHPWRVKPTKLVSLCVASLLWGGHLSAQQTPAPAPQPAESEVQADPVGPDVIASAVAAVGKLGDEVVMGRYQVAIERMYPKWKERAANRAGGMQVLEKQLAGVAAQMVQQGVSMISCKPKGAPTVYQVAPGNRTLTVNGAKVEKYGYTKWLVMVPTVTRFRIMRKEDGQTPKPIVIDSTSYQVAVSDKGANNWTFIDGAGLSVADLRALFITLPQDMKLPAVEKKEVR